MKAKRTPKQQEKEERSKMKGEMAPELENWHVRFDRQRHNRECPQQPQPQEEHFPNVQILLLLCGKEFIPHSWRSLTAELLHESLFREHS